MRRAWRTGHVATVATPTRQHRGQATARVSIAPAHEHAFLGLPASRARGCFLGYAVGSRAHRSAVVTEEALPPTGLSTGRGESVRRKFAWHRSGRHARCQKSCRSAKFKGRRQALSGRILDPILPALRSSSEGSVLQSCSKERTMKSIGPIPFVLALAGPSGGRDAHGGSPVDPMSYGRHAKGRPPDVAGGVGEFLGCCAGDPAT